MPSASSFFCCLFVSEKLFGEVSRNPLKIYGNYFQAETSPEPGGCPKGRQPASRRPPGAAHPLVAPGPHLAGSFAFSSHPFAYKFVFEPKTLSTRSYFPEHTRGAVISNPSPGGFCSSFRLPAREGNRHRRHLHHHASL